MNALAGIWLKPHRLCPADQKKGPKTSFWPNGGGWVDFQLPDTGHVFTDLRSAPGGDSGGNFFLLKWRLEFFFQTDPPFSRTSGTPWHGSSGIAAPRPPAWQVGGVWRRQVANNRPQACHQWPDMPWLPLPRGAQNRRSRHLAVPREPPRHQPRAPEYPPGTLPLPCPPGVTCRRRSDSQPLPIAHMPMSSLLSLPRACLFLTIQGMYRTQPRAHGTKP